MMRTEARPIQPPRLAPLDPGKNSRPADEPGRRNAGFQILCRDCQKMISSPGWVGGWYGGIETATMKSVLFNNTVLRDGHQSIAATRMATSQMLEAAPILDEMGFAGLETWGGATIDSCLRFLHENPFDRLRTLLSLAGEATPAALRGVLDSVGPVELPAGCSVMLSRMRSVSISGPSGMRAS